MGYACALLSALLFGANGSVAKVALAAGITPGQLTLFRSLSAALVGGVLLLATNRSALRVTRRELLNLAALGVIGVAMVQWLYAVALGRLPVGIALLIEYTAVLMVAVVARVFFAEAVVRGSGWPSAACWPASPPSRRSGRAISPRRNGHRGPGRRRTCGLLPARWHLVTRTSPLATAFWSMLFATLFWAAFSGWWDIDPSVFTQRISLGGHLSGTVLPVWVLLCYVMALGSFGRSCCRSSRWAGSRRRPRASSRRPRSSSRSPSPGCGWVRRSTPGNSSGPSSCLSAWPWPRPRAIPPPFAGRGARAIGPPALAAVIPD